MIARVLGAMVLLVAVLLSAFLFWPRDRQSGEAPPSAVLPADTDPLLRGAALVTLGDCRACHTARGGAAFAGGRAIDTPFGTFYSPNITPDAETGIGQWTQDDFWRALHDGRGRHGEPLYPTFPYTNYTKLSRADADAMYAYLQTIPASTQANREHALKFPYQYRALLHGWRLLFFRPGVYEADPGRSVEWNRGAYLVQGLGHCSACHEARNALGAIQSKDNPSGGLVLNWYAPALQAKAEAGVQRWSEDEIVALLKTGTANDAVTLGPMAEVVYESLQHVDAAELRAMAVYLRALPEREPAPADRASVKASVSAGSASARQLLGAKLYAEHCAGCHGEQGEGGAPAAPALAGNRALLMASAVNPIRVLLYGGYAPATAGNPRPYGMPPFAQSLSDEQIAAILSYTRTAWGNEAEAVPAIEVQRGRSGPLW